MAFDSIKKALFPQGDDTESIEDESYDVDSKSISKAGSKMVLVEPRAYSESQTIADHLKGRNSVVVNLKRVTANQAKRIIDFLTGTLYAIGGEMQKIGPGIYLCTPKDVEVQGSITDDEKAKDKNDEEIDW